MDEIHQMYRMRSYPPETLTRCIHCGERLTQRDHDKFNQILRPKILAGFTTFYFYSWDWFLIPQLELHTSLPIMILMAGISQIMNYWPGDIIIFNILPILLSTHPLYCSTDSQEWQILLGTTLLISKHSILCLKYL